MVSLEGKNKVKDRFFEFLRESRVPLLVSTSYQPPFVLQNGHFQTIFPSLFRRVRDVSYHRIRISTPDDDFIDLDRASVGGDKLGVIAHGLEGSSCRSYVLGMVQALNAQGWDAVAWNFRGCSGEPNRQIRFYHSGDTDDLNTVLKEILNRFDYRHIALIGFSMGGNVILKFLGEYSARMHPSIKAGIAFSVPCDLASAAHKLKQPSNLIYMRRFLLNLHEKIRIKMKQFPGRIDDKGYHLIHSFKEFDERYTAPLHGFESAEDYWAKSSSKGFLHRISIPVLMVNALDDPFLSSSCYPYEEALNNPCFFLEAPRFGGHVGFMGYGNGGNRYWSETRTVQFLKNQCNWK